MSKKLVYLITLVMMLFSSLTPTLLAADDGLVGWWKLDDGSGTIAKDSTSAGNNGTLNGNPQWVEGMLDGALQLDGTGDYVDLPIGEVIASLDSSCTFTWWVNYSGLGNNWQRMFDFGTGTGSNLFVSPNGGAAGVYWCTCTGAGAGLVEVVAEEELPTGWHHCALVIDAENEIFTLLLDGVEIQSTPNAASTPSGMGETTNNWLGRSQYDVDPYFNGTLDDFRIYNRLLTPEEIIEVMKGGPTDIASNPDPKIGDDDAAREPVLSWKPGMYANTHNLFLGTDFNDVNDATTANPLNAALFEGLDVNSCEPGRLEFGTVYYWRVDEVNAPSSPGTLRGDIWSFTVEPFARKIPASDINASASGSYGAYSPTDTINERGLDPNHMDLHSNGQPTMWLSNPGAPNSVWIQYDFEKVYKLHQMLVWNYNYPMLLKAGFKDVIVEYSVDGETWVEVQDVPQFAQGDGTNAYKYNTVVDFGDVVVKSVRIKQQTNWGMQVSGLSEVRFTYIPVWASKPKPEDGAVSVFWNKTLTWRPGREASQHNIYISTDEQAVIDGTVDPQTVSQASYAPLSLALAAEYYWRVDEVNNSEMPSLWAGDVWSFTTEGYITVDDFEDYNNTQPYTVWDVWIDGLTDTTYGGSRMGNEYEPFCEESIVYGGAQSAPLYYNVTSAAKSEVVADTSDLKIGSDWTKGSPEVLVLWFYGNAGNSADKLYVKLNNSKVYYNGDLLNLTRPAWWQWSIDLSEFNVNLASVQSITIGLEKVGSGVESHILIDEIRLYNEAPPVPTEDIWIEAESVTPTAPMQIVNDDEASGGKCIGTVNGSGDSTTGPATPAGTASYSFNVAGGDYRIEIRVNTPDGSGDSFWIRFPDATNVAPGTNAANPGWILFNDAGPGDGWEWDVVNSDVDNTQDVTVTLPAGSNTMQISYREDGAEIDVIRIMSVDE